MPCNNTAMMLPLAMESGGGIGCGGGGGPIITNALVKSAATSPIAGVVANKPISNSPTNMLLNNTNAQQQQQQQQQNQGSRYKTELCRPFEEFNVCKYGDKCQFAHGPAELRKMPRHPKYKTELCRTFHTLGLCPYGHRCHFIHNSDEIANNPANNGSPNGTNANSNNNANVNGNTGQQPTSIIGQTTTKDMVPHRSSSMSSSSSTASCSSSSGLGSGGSSPVYHHPYIPQTSGLPVDADLLTAAAASGLTFGPLAAAAQAHAQAQLAAVAAAASVLPPLSPSQSPSFCSSVPSLSSSPPLSGASNSSLSASHFYAPVNLYMESNHRLPVFWNLSP